jgi:hypothetical protein
MSLNPMTAADEAKLISDLRATFPGLRVAPIAGQFDSYSKIGARARGEADMPDGLLIFTTLTNDADEYDGYVHEGFRAWLESRGWYYEVYDLGILDILPAPVIAKAIHDLRDAFPYQPRPLTAADLGDWLVSP